MLAFRARKGRASPTALAIATLAASAVPLLSSGCTASSSYWAEPFTPPGMTSAPASSASSAPPTTPPPTSPPVTTPPPTTPPPVIVTPANLPLADGAGPAGSIMTTGGPEVALTFDDGPDPNYTPMMLDLLKAHGVTATFCLVGKQVRAHPELVRRIVAEGHTLCDHSWAHALDLGKQPAAAMFADLTDTNNAIRAAVPDAKIQYFRAPGGNFTPELVNVATALGMRPLYWSVDTRDWDFAAYGHGQSMVNHVISVVQSKTRRGAIILSHDLNKPDTITAYRTLLPWLKANVTLIALPVS